MQTIANKLRRLTWWVAHKSLVYYTTNYIHSDVHLSVSNTLYAWCLLYCKIIIISIYFVIGYANSNSFRWRWGHYYVPVVFNIQASQLSYHLSDVVHQFQHLRWLQSEITELRSFNWNFKHNKGKWRGGGECVLSAAMVFEKNNVWIHYYQCDW